MTSSQHPPLPPGEGWSEGIPGGNLHGLGVLITRPRHQAQPLYDAIQQCGGKPILFPTIEIAPPDNPELCKQQLKNATAYDDLIFISPNAVTYAIDDISIDQQRIFAIGAATGELLQQRNLKPHLPSGDKTDSENLLASPQLNEMHWRRVLIIRGNGGRALLGDTLKQRGALVDFAEVYQRRCPDVDATSLLQKWSEEIGIVITTSNAIIDNLIHLCRNDPLVLQTPLIVISQRMLKHANQLGFQHVYCARGTQETVILSALYHFLRV
jgi:uroporphyrinogen-III synthase